MDDDYLEAVLDLVADVPPGRVMTYGGIAEVLRERIGRGGARQVGQVMALAGGGVPWWRVVNAAGQPPARLRGTALARLREEGCPLTDDEQADDEQSDDEQPNDVDARVVVRRAVWWPDA